MLAMHLFFWDDWIPATPASTTANQSNAGGGKKRNHDYEGQPEAFWLVRERYLRQQLTNIPTPLPVTIKSPPTTAIAPQNLPPSNPPLRLPPTFDSTKLNRYQAELATALKLAEASTSIASLRIQAARVSSLRRIIREAQRQERNKRIKARNLRLRAQKRLMYASLLALALT